MRKVLFTEEGRRRGVFATKAGRHKEFFTAEERRCRGFATKAGRL
ncbi:MAG: hypothetical protein ACOZDD_13080 [Bacteroidota bacterium]